MIYKSATSISNGVISMAKGCQVTSLCSSFANGNLQNGRFNRCCNTTLCNNDIITPTISTPRPSFTTTSLYGQISCLTCNDCATNQASLLNCPTDSPYSCFVYLINSIYFLNILLLILVLFNRQLLLVSITASP